MLESLSLPSTVERVRKNTAPEINDQIARETGRRITETRSNGPEAIDRRLQELDEEWDIERTLEANAAAAVLAGTALAAFVDRRFLILPAVVGGFLLQHALQGWCPPLPIFRRRGVRTSEEIDRERDALKSLRSGSVRRPANEQKARPN